MHCSCPMNNARGASEKKKHTHTHIHTQNAKTWTCRRDPNSTLVSFLIVFDLFLSLT